MKNKYLEQLKEDGFFDEEFGEEQEEEIDLLPYDESKDAEELGRTVRGVITVTLILYALEFLIIFFLIGGIFPVFGKVKLTALAGLTVGTGAGIGLFFTMKNQLEDLMYLPEERANKKIRTGYLLRLSAAAMLAVIGGLTGFMHPVAAVLGIYNIKPACFLQPLYEKIYFRSKG